MSALERIPRIVRFVDEDGKDLGWGEHEFTAYQLAVIAALMEKWHQSFEVTCERMLRSGLRSIRRKHELRREGVEGGVPGD